MKIAYRSILMLMISILVFGMARNNAQAAAPHSVNDLYGWLQRNSMDSTKDYMAELSWSYYDDNSNLKGFYIYQAEGKTTNLSDFSLVATIDLSSQEDFWFQSDSSYWAILNTQYPSSTFYIKAFNDDGVSDASNFVVAEMQKVDEYYYMSMNLDSNQQLKIGQEFTTQIIAYTNIENPQVSFSLANAPDGMTIDPETAVITWTPAEGGYYNFSVIAAVTAEGMERSYTQGFELNVLQCENPGSIKGTITDSKGNAISSGVVYAYRISTWSTDSITYQYPVVAASVNVNNGEYEIENLDKGDYYLFAYDYTDFSGINLPTFYEKALSIDSAQTVSVDCGQTAMASWSLIKNILNVRFTTYPESTRIKFGEKFTYDADAEGGDDSKPLVFEMSQGPEGATLDSQTGLLEFTPSHNGSYSFTITVNRKDDSLGYWQMDIQNFILHVVQCEQLSTISLTLKNQAGDIIEDGYATLVEKNSDDLYGKFNNAVYTQVVNGIARFDSLDAGDYFVQAYGFDKTNIDSLGNGQDTVLFKYDEYYPTWYKTAFDFNDATPITIECNSNFTDDIVLMMQPEIHYNSVSGYVTDKSDNSPIIMAYLQFNGTEKNTGMSATSYTVTDTNGFYSVSLQDNFTWTAYCMAGNMWFGRNDSLQFDEKMYFPQYYDDVTNPMDAKVLDLTQSYENVNFALTQIPEFDNSLTGKVTLTSGSAIPNITVIAFLVEPENDQEQMYFARTSVSDTAGMFTFTNLIPGKYIMFAWDESMSLAPGYYLEGSVVIDEWENATNVTVASTGKSGDYNIQMDFFHSINGICSIGGKVGKQKNTTKVGDDVLADDALQGAIVYVTDLNGKTIGSVSTKDDGSFEIGDLAPGTYRLVAGKVGYKTYTSEFTVGENNPKAQEDVKLSSGTNGVTDNTNTVSSATVYPNPASTMLSVKFQSQGGNSTVKMLDNAGKIVYSVNVNAISGLNEVKIKTSSMPQGAYFITISGNGGTQMVPVTVVK